jgi:bifunctional DNase/RNase
MAQGMREMVVDSVRVHMLSTQHVVILREADRERYLPIWIGSWEAQAIAMKLQGVEAERPLTHDLLVSILGETGVRVRRIIVSDLADETYRARVVLSRGEDEYDIDARPSDAIALAVRVSAPIFATDAVLDRAAVMPEADEEERLSVFRDFVNSLDADFGPPSGEGGSGPGSFDVPLDDRPREDRPPGERRPDEGAGG